MKSVFLGTPDFSIPALETLAKYTDVCLVVTQEDKKRGRGKKYTASPIKKRALELGLEVFQPKDINSLESIDRLSRLKADLFVVVAYGQILKKDFLAIAKKDIVNIHASLLPKLRGAAPIQYAILQGHEKTGVCIMRVEEGLDSGPVAMCREIAIEDMDYGALSQKLSGLGGELLKDYLLKEAEGDNHFIDQDHNESTYAPKIENDMTWLDFYGEKGKDLCRKVRALSPTPGARFSIEDTVFKVFQASLIEANNLLPGEFLVEKNGLYIGSREGVLSIEVIQRPGKNKMSVSSFLAGFSLDKGKVNPVQGG